jgi:glutamate synthase (NADPH) small chain
MKETRLYLPSEREDFHAATPARQVEREVVFSTDPRDFGWIQENIPCQKACPALTNIPGYIRCIYEERYGRSYELNRYVNILPGVLGRICARPCEPACRHGWADNGEPVAICHLKRVAADFRPEGHRIQEQLFAPSGKKVAVIGAGPAGLAAAHDLATFGHRVSLYEAEKEPGGMLRYGIPEFRLPRDLLAAEIANVLRLGVDLHLNARIGPDLPLDKLLTDYDAVMLCTGTYRPNRAGIPGEDLPGVYSGLEFMMRVNEGERPSLGEKVQVVGGGFTAMDCARTSIRLGAKRVLINILTTEEFLPVDKEELFQVKYEGIEVRGLVSIQEIKPAGRRKSVRFKRNRLGGWIQREGVSEREGVPIPDSDFEDDADSVIMAIGQRPDPAFLGGVDLDRTERGLIRKDPQTGLTSRPGLFLAGDFGSGASNVIKCIGSGRNTAWQVDRFLTGHERRKNVVRFESMPATLRERKWDFIPRQPMPTLSLPDRLAGTGGSGVETGLDRQLGAEEAKRCYLCYLRFEIDVERCIFCRWCIDVMPKNCIKLAQAVERNPDGSIRRIVPTEDWSQVAAVVIDSKECIRCGNCWRVCPVKCIEIVKVELINQDVEA